MAEEAKAKETEKAPEKEAPKGKEAEGKEGDAPAEGDAAAPKGLLADKKKLIMFGGIGAAVLLIIAGAAIWFFVLKTPKEAETDSVVGGAGAADGARAGPSVYYDVPEFSLNLAPSGQQEHFLRLKVTLELATAEEQKTVETNAARLQDDYLQYLRQLRLDDLRGNAGLQRMKEDLLLRASQTLAPVRVKNVLFREVLVQ
ncbi:MAG TPA: flagellar basal body-associated FliL family protein [Alphaproteobacteria bacterium]|nr:flagellar basal body-associated FliL family protein [Alphaproteobacteria bacterium]